MNILLPPDGPPVVIDWTNFRISDARFDLAWTLVLSYAHASAEWRELILNGYERHAGAPVEALDYFEAFASARRLFDVSISLTLGAEKLGMRADAMDVIRKHLPAHKRVYQLFMQRTGLRVQAIERLFSITKDLL